MNILMILAHPDLQSFNHAIAQTAAKKLTHNGHHVVFHDLYQEQFDPVLLQEEIPKSGKINHRIKQHCHDLTQADGIVIIHPNWWGMPPALLKGWIDRVLRPGIAYEFVAGDQGEGVPRGLLRAKAAIIFNTSNTAAERENLIFLDPLETLWKNCIFNLCGVPQFYRRMFRIIVTSTKAERHQWLREVEQVMEQYFPR